MGAFYYPPEDRLPTARDLAGRVALTLKTRLEKVQASRACARRFTQT
jgi:hypothetical protein